MLSVMVPVDATVVAEVNVRTGEILAPATPEPNAVTEVNNVTAAAETVSVDASRHTAARARIFFNFILKRRMHESV